MSLEELAIARADRILPFAGTPVFLRERPDFLEKLPLAIYACDADGRILWFNARAAQLWGRAPRIGDETDGYCGSYRLYLQGLEIARDEAPMASVLRTGIPIRGAEGKVERADGSSIWAKVHIEPVRDEGGGIVGAINCFQLTTPLHQSADEAGELFENAAAGLHQRLAATYEHAGVGIAEVDAEGKLRRVNAQLAELMGYSSGQLLGRSIFDETCGDDVERDYTQFRRQVAGEIDRYSVEKRIRRRDGNHIWTSVVSSSVRDADGGFLYAVRVQHDISDRRRAEEALLQRMEEQAALYEFTERLQHAHSLDEVYERALDAIVRALRCRRASVLLLDTSGVMRFASWRDLSDDYRRAVEGHSPWTREELDPRPICIPDIEQADLPELLKQTLRAEGIRALAFIPLQESGRLLGKFMTYYDTPHDFADGEIGLALTIARQLGFAIGRKHAQWSEQQLASIVKSSHDAVVSKDLDGIITTWNLGAERLFGYRADEAVGKPITILIPSDRLDEEPGILARIRRGELVDHYETIRRRKDGSLVDISLTVSPMRDARGTIVGASKIARDITERKDAEARLRESEQRLKDLLAAIPAAIYTTDAKGRITYYNEMAAEFAGRTPSIGDEWCVTWKLYWPDGTPLPHDQCPMAIALKEGRPVRNVEAIAERPDGTRVPFIPYPTPLRDANGKIVGAINMLVDVSERKQAETQQRVLFNELNHRVKNNMQMLQSLLHLAARKSNNAEAQKALGEASSRVAAMAAAQQVLYGTTAAASFNAREFLQAVCNTAQQTFPDGVNVVVREADDCEISNDSAMPLALILNELLTNAAKHGVDEGGRGTVRVGLTRRRGSFSLTVEDDGPGFDLQSVRGRSSGLQLVLGLARQLRGRFDVVRSPGCRCSVQFE